MSILSWLGQSPDRRLAAASGPPVATYRFVFGRNRCHIQATLDPSWDHDTLLLVSYIAFLFRCFYQSTWDQIRPISDYLLANIGNAPANLPRNFSSHSVALHRILIQTYGRGARRAAEQAFRGVPPSFEGYALSTTEPEQTRVANLAGTLGRYTFQVTPGLVPLLDMSFGPHLVLLPQTALLFYAYVVDQFHEATTKIALDRFVRLQVESQRQWDPARLETMVRGTNALFAAQQQSGSGNPSSAAGHALSGKAALNVKGDTDAAAPTNHTRKQVDAVTRIVANLFEATTAPVTTAAKELDPPIVLKFEVPDSRFRFMMFSLTTVGFFCTPSIEDSDTVLNQCWLNLIQAAVSHNGPDGLFSGPVDQQKAAAGGLALVQDFLKHWQAWAEARGKAGGRCDAATNIVCAMLRRTECASGFVSEEDRHRLWPLACWVEDSPGWITRAFLHLSR